MATEPEAPAGNVWRFDVVAGLTAAAVVIPKAMAYAAVAGLPVAVGLYTAFIPMIVYAVLGRSRVLSVSSTTTLAILAGTELAIVVPDGDPAKLITATATLAALVGAMLVLARVARLGFVADFISTPVLTGFKAGIGLVIVLDQIPKLLGTHITKQGFFPDLLSVAQHVPETSLLTLGGGASRRWSCWWAWIGSGRTRRRRWWRWASGIAASWLFGLQALGVSTIGKIPQGLPSITLPDLSLVMQLAPAAAGMALMSFTESIASARAFARPGDPPVDANRELVAVGAGNLAGALTGCDAGRAAARRRRRSSRAAGGRSQRTSLVTAAAALATMLLVAPLLGLLPNATLAMVVIVYSVGLIQPAEFRAIRAGADDGVPLGGGGDARRARVRHAAGHRGRDHRFADRPVEPGGAADGARDRPQARRRRAAARSRREFPDDETFEGLLILRPEGRLFFANAQSVAEQIQALIAEHKPRVVALDMSRVPDIEYSALQALIEGEKRTTERGIDRLAGRAEPDRARGGAPHRARRAARPRADALQRPGGDRALPGLARSPGRGGHAGGPKACLGRIQ